MTDIVVVGSINMDVVNRVPFHAVPGETIAGFETSYSPGGKGANQAVAAARSGASVSIVGAVGNDPFGSELRRNLDRYGVSTEPIVEKTGSSGLAFITVDALGQNSIVLSSGANRQMLVSDVERVIRVFDRADVVLVQNEIPWETTKFVIHQAHLRGIKVFFNPAPALQIPNEVFSMIDYMVLNESEATVITGISVDTPHNAVIAAQTLIERGVESVVVTLGELGSVYRSRDGRQAVIPAFSVQTVDSTAAGDTFVGALSAVLGEAETIEDALRFASAAAAISVTRQGAQDSIPLRSEVEELLRAVPSP